MTARSGSGSGSRSYMSEVVMAAAHPTRQAILKVLEKGKLETLLDVVREVADDRIPQLDKVTRVRLMLSYPWSVEEEG
jgi:mevalonate pyrophosphate decarboxylase